jgi:hypothetical protein
MQLRHASSWNRFADRNETNSGGAQTAKIIIRPSVKSISNAHLSKLYSKNRLAAGQRPDFRETLFHSSDMIR